MQDTNIEFNSGCMYQPNAVQLNPENIIVFDACGACVHCYAQGHNKPWVAVAENGKVRKATTLEANRQDAAHASIHW